MEFTRRTMMAAGAVLAAPNFNTEAQAQVRTPVQGQAINTRIGKLSFTHDFANGYPTKGTVEKIYDERDFQRACQIYLWAIPLVSFGEVEHVLMDAPGAVYGDIIRVDTVPGIKRFLTGNATTPYMMSWLNLAKSGPLVVDMPAGASAGFVDDMWQRPVTDLGQPGPDKGQGGKYLILGPGQTAPEGAQGYTVVQSSTFNNLWLVRLLALEAQEREAMLAKIRLYPFSQRSNAAANKVISLGAGASYANAPRGFIYWEKLSHIGVVDKRLAPNQAPAFLCRILE
jgi:hypothetical protein